MSGRLRQKYPVGRSADTRRDHLPDGGRHTQPHWREMLRVTTVISFGQD
jgi:hypothetical protein